FRPRRSRRPRAGPCGGLRTRSTGSSARAIAAATGAAYRDAIDIVTCYLRRRLSMPRVFLTHTPDMLRNYYGDNALAALRNHAEVRINETDRVLDADTLAQAARGCEIIVSDRQTPGPAALFRQVPDLVALLRCAVDIRNVDVQAASQAGILVTHATPGFAASVAEMAVGFMVDLARSISDSVLIYRQDRAPEARPGRQLKGATLGIIGYGTIGRYLAPIGQALGMQVIVSDPYQAVSAAGIRQVEL